MEKKWWKESVIYQVYPRSFYDSNGDGIGDLQGIIQKLDYIKELGMKAIWLNPIYTSPNDDMGYDISDYKDIMKEFGTMDDFKELLYFAHEKGIRIIMDLVVNHSSDEHKWFIESRKSKESEYRDYYIWRKGKNADDKVEPNNWASFFTPSAWKYDQETKEYYLHLFSEKQPDLNWENKKVRDEIYQMINYWLDMGVDGFRMDVINLIAKKEFLPDGNGGETSCGYSFCPENFANQEKMFHYLEELRDNCFEARDCMCVGETPFVNPSMGQKFIQGEKPLLDMIFQFELMDIDSGRNGKWDIVSYDMDDFKRIIAQWQKSTEVGWGSLFWSNHDQPRPISRFVSWKTEDERKLAAKMLGAAMHLMKGTSFVFQGEEIGMTNMPFSNLQELRDIESIQYYKELEKTGKKEEAWNGILKKGRDHARTPMQWDTTKHGGFSKGDPWIGVNPNYKYINVDNAKNDEFSILNYYKDLISFKSKDKVAIYGEFELLETKQKSIFAYQRKFENRYYQVFANFSKERLSFLKTDKNWTRILLNNYTNIDPHNLQPFEVRVYYYQ